MATEVTLDRLRQEDKKGRGGTDAESEQPEEIPLAFQRRKPITVMKRLLSTGKQISDNRPAFDKAIVQSVRHFCLDKELDLSIRLSVLRLLKDNSCAVNDDDEALLLHLETMAHLQETWPDVSVTQSEIETSQGRGSVFSKLLDASSNHKQLDTLCRLLTTWPAFDTRSVHFSSSLKLILFFESFVSMCVPALFCKAGKQLFLTNFFLIN